MKNKQYIKNLQKLLTDSLLEQNKKSLIKWNIENTNSIDFFQDVFSNGLCFNFQEASKKFLPDWIEYTIMFGEDEYDYGQHYVLKHPTKDLFFDVFGLRIIDDILKTYDAQNDPYIWHGEAEGCHFYSVDDDIVSDIAILFIDLYNDNIKLAS